VPLIMAPYLSPRLLPLLLGIVWVSAQATDWRSLALPDRTQGEWVLGEARVNGVPMQTQRLTSRLTVEQLLAHFEDQWKRWGSVRRATTAGWQTLSVNTGPVQLTLQAKAAQDGSEGILTQAAWPERQRDFLPPELPDLPRTDAQQVTESRDGPRRSRLVHLLSQDNLELNRQRWQAYARRKGWALTTEKLLKQSGQQHWLASFTSGGALTLDLVLSQSDAAAKTSITANFLDTVP